MTMTTGVIAQDHRTADGRIDVGKLKARIGLADLAGRLTKLKRVGSGWRGLCPFHNEKTPSFCVSDKAGLWHCFGCGRGGDAIGLLIEAGADGFLDACGQLAEAGGVATAPHMRVPSGSCDVRRIKIALARQEWRSSGAVAGTPAEAYLAARGLAGNVPGSLRFGRTPRVWDEDTRLPGPRHPALIAAAQDVSGRITGVQRIFVDPTRSSYPFRPLRLSLGRIRGSALRLGPARDTVMLAGSVEDGLALMKMFVGASVWCSLGEANLQNVVFPPVVRRVILCGDADDPGRAAIARAGAAHQARSLDVEELLPKAGKDFNEEWLLLHA